MFTVCESAARTRSGRGAALSAPLFLVVSPEGEVVTAGPTALATLPVALARAAFLEVERAFMVATGFAR